ncbi:ribonuclease H-like YkuK family protein [Patescibacteria group bacterium]|nr:ribonuclease H-like YkuK family protein [Patescibacteria group bacterium]
MSVNATFYNSTIKRRINFDQLIKEIIRYVNEKPNADYRITIGTDSPGVINPFFVTAVTVLRVGNGGRYFWTKSERIFCHGLQERIYKEAMRSITLTQELKSKLKDELGEESFWDNKITVHIDIGRNGSTKDLVDGVVGMVRGFGLEAVIKPDAFCACSVADKHT